MPWLRMPALTDASCLARCTKYDNIAFLIGTTSSQLFVNFVTTEDRAETVLKMSVFNSLVWLCYYLQ